MPKITSSGSIHAWQDIAAQPENIRAFKTADALTLAPDENKTDGQRLIWPKAPQAAEALVDNELLDQLACMQRTPRPLTRADLTALHTLCLRLLESQPTDATKVRLKHVLRALNLQAPKDSELETCLTTLQKLKYAVQIREDLNETKIQSCWIAQAKRDDMIEAAVNLVTVYAELGYDELLGNFLHEVYLRDTLSDEQRVQILEDARDNLISKNLAIPHMLTETLSLCQDALRFFKSLQ